MTTLKAIISAAKLPETPAEGMKVALTEDYTLSGGSGGSDTKYEKGNVYYYTKGKWELYKGQDVAA